LFSDILTGLVIRRELTSDASMFEQPWKWGFERLSPGQGGSWHL